MVHARPAEFLTPGLKRGIESRRIQVDEGPRQKEKGAGRSPPPPPRADSFLLAAAPPPSAAHAAIAASVADHDGAANAAAWRIAHVVHVAHCIRRVVNTAVRQIR